MVTDVHLPVHAKQTTQKLRPSHVIMSVGRVCVPHSGRATRVKKTSTNATPMFAQIPMHFVTIHYLGTNVSARKVLFYMKQEDCVKMFQNVSGDCLKKIVLQFNFAS